MDSNDILRVLRHQRDNGVDGSVYKLAQCEFAYNSNHMEGSRLTHDQTRTIFEHGIVSGNGVLVDDILEAQNHFRAFDFLLDNVDTELDDEFLFKLQGMLKEGTRDSRNPIMSIGSYKIAENMIGDFTLTASPEEVPAKMANLLSRYYAKQERSFDDLLDFHAKFEKIHPFSDGNGRVGRLVLFKECLANDILPFIITDDLKPFYIRGLQNWEHEKGYLRDTCLTAQDRFEAKYVPLAESYAKALDKLSERQPFEKVMKDKQQEAGFANEAKLHEETHQDPKR